MPGPSAKGKGKTGEKEGGVTIQQYCDVLKGDKVVNEQTGKVVRRQEAAVYVWSHALRGEAQREEIFKTQCTSGLMSMLERGDTEERFAAVGALYALAQSDKHISEVATGKVIFSCASLLLGDHDRSKPPAAQLLAFLAQRPEYANKVGEAAMPALMQLLMSAAPGWGQARPLLLHCTTALRALIENVQGDAVSEIKMSRRVALIAAGAVARLVSLVAYVPRMPPPARVPSPPPANAGSKKKPGKEAKKSVVPKGQKDAIATSAAACLRFLALCPNFVEELLGCGSLPEFVGALLTANDEQAAYLCGVLWEITAEADVAQRVVDAGAVPLLLHVISSFLGSVKGKSKPKKKKAEGESGSKKADKHEPPPPPSYPDIAVCNAAGALHHLTFLDDAKIQVGRVGGAPILAACLRVGNITTFENATGALWNCGLDAKNTQALFAAGAPDYLVKPVPDAWVLDNPPSAQMQQLTIQVPSTGAAAPGSPTHRGPSVFLTQAAVPGL